uniref:hypothetical protein n=1 Tax=Haliangium sp. TaxID=2663208 RepID=UPI003D096A10
GAAAIVTEKWNIGAAFVVVEDPADAVLQVEFRDVDTGLAIGKELMFRPTLTPVGQQTGASTQAPWVQLSRGRGLGDNFYAQMLIHNDGRAPLRIDVNHVDAFAGAERIEGARMAMVDPVVEHANARTIAVITPGQVGHAMLWLPNVSEDRATPLTVRLHDISGQHELKVAVREWEVELDRDDDQPLSAEEYQDLILSFAGDVNASARPFADHWTDGRDAVTIRSSFLAYGSETGVIAFKVTNDGQFDFS